MGRKDVIETIHDLNKKEGITIILVTHNMEEVIDADKVYVLDKGKVVMEGKPREVFSQRERLKEYKLEVPQATMIGEYLKEKGIPISKTVLSIDELIDELKNI